MVTGIEERIRTELNARLESGECASAREIEFAHGLIGYLRRHNPPSTIPPRATPWKVYAVAENLRSGYVKREDLSTIAKALGYGGCVDDFVSAINRSISYTEDLIRHPTPHITSPEAPASTIADIFFKIVNRGYKLSIGAGFRGIIGVGAQIGIFNEKNTIKIKGKPKQCDYPWHDSYEYDGFEGVISKTPRVQLEAQVGIIGNSAVGPVVIQGGYSNTVVHSAGVQLGFGNDGEESAAVAQVGVLNQLRSALLRTALGVQLGIINYARHLSGIQVGVLNRGDSQKHGLLFQIGIHNRVDEDDGGPVIQIGISNYSDGNTPVYQLGLWSKTENPLTSCIHSRFDFGLSFCFKSEV